VLDGLLKLQEQERRTWAAMLSTIRALERRQKVDGCADEQVEEESASVKTPAPNEPISEQAPAPVSEAPRDAQVPSRDDDAAAPPSAAARVDAHVADVSPAPNEPISEPCLDPRAKTARAEIDKPPSAHSLCET